MRENVKHALQFTASRFSPDALSAEDLVRIDGVLRKRYAALDAWPADAQLGLYVLGWVLGPGFSLKGFAPSVNRLVPDFAAAARAVGPGSTPTTVSLGGMARQAFRNAAVVCRWNLVADLLYWPLELADHTGSGVSERDVL